MKQINVRIGAITAALSLVGAIRLYTSIRRAVAAATENDFPAFESAAMEAYIADHKARGVEPWPVCPSCGGRHMNANAVAEWFGYAVYPRPKKEQAPEQGKTVRDAILDALKRAGYPDEIGDAVVSIVMARVGEDFQTRLLSPKDREAILEGLLEAKAESESRMPGFMAIFDKALSTDDAPDRIDATPEPDAG